VLCSLCLLVLGAASGLNGVVFNNMIFCFFIVVSEDV